MCSSRIIPPTGTLATAHTQLVIGRLKPGVTAATADAEMKLIAHRLESQFPDSNRGWGAAVTPLIEQVVSEARAALMVFAGAVTFVLLIACANVASLLLVRNSARQKELAIRRAMGAAENQLLRQLLTESLLVGLAGGAIGLLLAYGAVHALVAIGPEALPRLEEIRVDGRALAFTAIVSLLTGLACGLMPALQTRRAAPFDILKNEGRSVVRKPRQDPGATSAGDRRNRDVDALLAGAGLLLRSYLRLQQVNPGFRTEQVLSLQVTAPTRSIQSPSKFPRSSTGSASGSPLFRA